MAFLMKSYLKFVTARHLLRTTTKTAEYFSTSTSFEVWQKQNQNPDQGSSGDGGEAKNTAQKKSRASIKITLLQNQNITVTALEEARNLAKRRSMHLVLVQEMDSKTQRPVYKLMTSAERLQEELSELKSQGKDGGGSTASDKTDQKKSEKTLNIGARIADHDLSSRIKNISKWLEKRHEVRILIQGSDNDMSSSEKVFKVIEESIKSPETIGKIVQKRTKGSVIKFNILPVTAASDKPSSATNQ